MKTNNYIQTSTTTKNSFAKLLTFQLLLIILIGLAVQSSAHAQEVQYTRPSWKFGVAAGANFNFFRGSTQELTTSFTPPTAFHDGDGIGLFLAPLLEYHRPKTYFGFMFQTGFDSRRGNFNQVVTPCNCAADLETKLNYFTIEPSLRFAPFKSDFYLYGGPRLAFNIDKSFTYQQHTNPDFPLQEHEADVTGDFSAIENTILSMQIGMGYDFQLSTTAHKTQFVLSPFAAFHPYFGQNPRSTETWNLTTFRAGIALKMGSGKRIEIVDTSEKKVTFSINTPKNERVENRFREVFPLRNYVFFDFGSTQIPIRYVLLDKNQVKNFREDQVQLLASKNKSKRSDRQMIVYYNLLNILGDRMQKNPSSTINLVGSSDNGKEEGLAMTTTIQSYLVSIFEIKSERISVEGRLKPIVPSEQPGGKRELDLLREGDRRVTIESKSPELLMEFQSGDAPLRPIEILSSNLDENSDAIKIFAIGSSEAFTSWSLELKDSNGKVGVFGPYTKDEVIISRKELLKTQKEGTFVAVLIGQAKNGTVVKKETTMRIVPNVISQVTESIRFSVIFEFNESKSIAIYENYLTKIVAAKIPIGATVEIKGYTDVIGDENYNKTLSLARANDVKTILEKSLNKSGRTDVKFQVMGYGENKDKTLFENNFPEERFYNRTVVIDIIANKKP